MEGGGGGIDGARKKIKTEDPVLPTTRKEDPNPPDRLLSGSAPGKEAKLDGEGRRKRPKSHQLLNAPKARSQAEQTSPAPANASQSPQPVAFADGETQTGSALAMSSGGRGLEIDTSIPSRPEWSMTDLGGGLLQNLDPVLSLDEKYKASMRDAEAFCC